MTASTDRQRVSPRRNHPFYWTGPHLWMRPRCTSGSRSRPSDQRSSLLSQLTGSEEMSNLVRTSTGPPFNSEPRKRFHSEYFHYDHTSKTSRFPPENGHFSSKI